MSGEINHNQINNDRRHFLSSAAMTVAAAQFGMAGSANAQSKTGPTNVPPAKPRTTTTFASLKQIDAGLLNVGYAEAGPPSGPAVILLQGWPYDIYSYADVAPLVLGPAHDGRASPGSSCDH
jgi:hypothetical protein